MWFLTVRGVARTATPSVCVRRFNLFLRRSSWPDLGICLVDVR